MLLYRYAKMMEQQRKGATADQAGEDYPELMEMKARMEEVQLGLFEEDCTDWAEEAGY